MSMPCCLPVKTSSILDGSSMSVAGRSREVSLLFLLDTGESASRVLCPVWGFPVGKKDIDILE